jgi:hypothetical protein
MRRVICPGHAVGARRQPPPITQVKYGPTEGYGRYPTVTHEAETVAPCRSATRCLACGVCGLLLLTFLVIQGVRRVPMASEL